MNFDRKKIGQEGESAVAQYLKNNGYTILEQNYQKKIGEIDIIAKSQGCYCFIEVKTRQSIDYGTGHEAVVKNKQKTIAKLAAYYLNEHSLADVDVRFDVASVLINDGAIQIDLIENAFEADF